MKQVICSLFLALLLASHAPAQSPAPEATRYADLVLHNAKIVTVDERGTIAQAVAIKEGKFLAAGKNPEILRLAGPKTVRIDLKGKTVLPGLIDTHTHPQEYALEHWGVDHPILRYVQVGGKTEEEVLGEIKRTLDNTVRILRPGQWIRLNLDDSEAGRALLREGMLTNATIDPITPENPVLIKSSTRALLNSKGIEEYLKEFGGADPEMDVKTGYLRSASIVRDMNADLFMKDRLEELTEIYRKELFELAGYGITTWSSSLSAVNNLAALRLLERKGQLPVRVAWGHGQGVSMSIGPEYYRRLGDLTGSGSDYLWNNGVGVISVDGSYPELCTTVQAQERVKSREICRLTEGQSRAGVLYSMVKAGHRIANIHVAGDRSLDLVLEIIEQASKEAGLTLDQIRAKRHAVDHGRPSTFLGKTY